MRLGRLLPVLAVLAPLALPAGAAADFQRIFGDYKSDGRIDGCYRPHEIHEAGKAIPPDIEQYAPGFADALGSAQSRCGSGRLPTAEPEEADEPVVASAGTPGRGTGIKRKKAVREPPAPEVAEAVLPADLATPRLAPATAAVSADTPGPLVALLIAAAIAVGLALAWTLAWFMGWSPERVTRPLSAAFGTVWERLSPGR